jgi:uncharacterized membrane protein YeaQ/YmgE (transglycosylase-associated protein family)
MNIIIYLIAGAVVGWVASVIMHTNSRQGLLQDIIVGVVGAFIAGYFLTPIFGVAPISVANPFSMPALLVSLGGAIILLAIVKLFRRR